MRHLERRRRERASRSAVRGSTYVDRSVIRSAIFTLVKLMRFLKGFAVSVVLMNPSNAAEGDVVSECPTKGMLEVVVDPASWADGCFQAINGRLPSSEASGERLSMHRDLDLDGADERLEVRGVGNKLKQIYVFRRDGSDFRYMGRLNASPDFYIARDRDNKLLLVNVYQAGADEVYIQQIEYLDGEFQIIRQDLIQ